MEESPNYYSIIPSIVRYDDDLKPNEKLLYGEITALTNKNGECWASNRYFADLYKVHVNTVSLWIQHLKEKDLISTKIIYKEDNKTIDKRIIKITSKTIIKNNNEVSTKILRGYQQKYWEGINKNVEENNTSINNTRINNNSNSSISNIYTMVYREKDMSKIANFFNENIHPITPIEYQKLESWLNDFTTDIILHAIEISVTNNKRSLAYMESILRDWKCKNYKSLSDIELNETKKRKSGISEKLEEIKKRLRNE